MTQTSFTTLTVRYWAAARSAAGVAEEPAEPGRVADVLAAAETRHPELVPVLAVASVLVDGLAVGRDAEAPAGCVLEVLPPFAGG
ncbi:MoaD/ThiS family protein [Austwickia chelonae]|uniref:MoaD/ThiS family protein n=1 Tax=Austwickia chelonae TaxID=100225 RepID=UPI001F07B9ED|nr:MoaD/ThiS family protein [Austwickia chelonae]